MKKVLSVMLILALLMTSFISFADEKEKKVDVDKLKIKFKEYEKTGKIELSKEEKEYIKIKQQETRDRVEKRFKKLEKQLENLKPNFDGIEKQLESINSKTNELNQLVAFDSTPDLQIYLGQDRTPYGAHEGATDLDIVRNGIGFGDISFTNLNTSYNKMHTWMSAGSVITDLSGMYDSWGQIGLGFKVNGSGYQLADIVVNSNTKGSLKATGDGDAFYRVRGRIYDLTDDKWVGASSYAMDEHWSFDLLNINDTYAFNRSINPEISGVKLYGGHSYVVVTEMITSGDGGILGIVMTKNSEIQVPGSGYGLNQNSISLSWR